MTTNSRQFVHDTPSLIP